jgi:quinoprotein glucose dehydrogenase
VILRSTHTAPCILRSTTLLFAVLSAPIVFAAADKWHHYGGSQHGLQYSSLDQINIDNVTEFEEVWRYRTGELGEGHPGGFAFEANPVIAEAKLYLTTGSAIIIALDPLTGTEVWRYDPQIDRSRPRNEIANRGVTSWIDPAAAPDAQCRHRIITGTLDARLIAVDGATGALCSSFGDDGQIYLDQDIRITPGRASVYSVTSPPVIVGDVLVIGSAIGDNVRVEEALGIVRGLDVRTGQERWRWDPIPRSPDDPAFAGWDPAEAALTGAANAWAPLSADEALGLVYVPTGSASPDFYGGERRGDNLYANSLVALRAATGKVVWHQQLVHHDVWDYDLPSQPTLVDLRHDGKTIPVVIQPTKMGMLFTFNRITGEPIFEIEERPVPQGGVLGEHLSATQPFPVAPEPYVRHAPVTAEDAFGLLLFDEWACADELTAMRSEGIYTPPSLEGTIELPSYAGGSNWGGLAFSPHHQLAVVNAIDTATEVRLIPREELDARIAAGEVGSYGPMHGTPYVVARDFVLSPLGMPCVAPPWGTLTGIDMEEGRIRWQVPLGTVEDMAPAIFPNLEYGGPTLGGPMITAGGLVFIGGAPDNYLRAFDLTNGAEIWKGRLPANAQATPMTYRLEETDRQYVVIAAGGHPRAGLGSSDYVVAFALPGTR